MELNLTNETIDRVCARNVFTVDADHWLLRLSRNYYETIAFKGKLLREPYLRTV